jgi:hypothetical protein
MDDRSPKTPDGPGTVLSSYRLDFGFMQYWPEKLPWDSLV